MRFRKILFALTLVAPLGLGASPTEAAFLTGTLGFNADVTTPNTGNVNTATVFTFTTNAGGANTQTTTGPATGSFAAVPPGTVVNSTPLTLTGPGPYLTLTLAPNSFTATFLVADVAPIANARTVELRGTIAGVGFDPTPARFILQFNQAGGPNTTVSYAGTLSAIPIPEPSSCVLMGVGGIFVLAYARFRRARPC